MRTGLPFGLTAAVVMGLGGAGGQGPAQEPSPPPKAGRHALLVGCTKYPNLPSSMELNGPANDVLLMRDLLVGRFGFPKDNVVILSEAAGDKNRPTRAHIERELRHLAGKVKSGDQVVTLLSGHGSQQPDDNPDDPDDLEPDGLDEIFLPADTGEWHGQQGKIPNAIRDDEIRVWLKAIRDKGASVWAVIDCCHSGTMVRGADEDVLRQVPAEKLVPEAALEAARKRAAQRREKARGARPEASPFEVPDKLARVVATYAALPSEITVEKSMPPDAADAKPYGLLTYTLCQVLTQAATPLTYRELTQRIHAQYIHWGRTFPTPLVEGGDSDREVLGEREWPGRTRFLLNRAPQGKWHVNGGTLHGLTRGSVLAVYPPAGQAGADKPVGHARIRRPGTFEAEVEPCEYDKMPVREDLPVAGRCQPVYIDYGSMRLRVAADDKDRQGRPLAEKEKQRLLQPLRKLAGDKGSLVEVADGPRKADWLVRAEGEQVYLLPAHGVQTQGGTPETPLFGPFALDEEFAKVLQDRLSRIARANNLLALASDTAGEATRETGTGVNVAVELLRFRDGSDRKGEVVRWEGTGLTLHQGDLITLRFHNRGRVDVDLTILFVDSGYGIRAVFPRKGDYDWRLKPGKSMDLPRRMEIDSEKTIGLEHVVVMAVAKEGEPIEFSCLEQPTLESARKAFLTPRTIDPFDGTPLGRLFQNALYATGTQRGLRTFDRDNYAFRLLSWHTSPQERGAGKKE